jgi:hypothetical protein
MLTQAILRTQLETGLSLTQEILLDYMKSETPLPINHPEAGNLQLLFMKYDPDTNAFFGYVQLGEDADEKTELMLLSLVEEGKIATFRLQLLEDNVNITFAEMSVGA